MSTEQPPFVAKVESIVKQRRKDTASLLKLAETGEFAAPCHEDCTGVITYDKMVGMCPLYRDDECPIPEYEAMQVSFEMRDRGFPRKYVRDAVWDQCQAAEVLTKWLDERPLHEGLLLHGPTGTGKTMAATLVARGLWEERKSWFVSWPEMIERFADNDFDAPKLIESGLLVLDDFGVGQIAPWAMGSIDRLFEHRNSRMLPTIVTTNLTPRTLKQEPEWQRFVDRWQETMLAVSMPGASQRGTK